MGVRFPPPPQMKIEKIFDIRFIVPPLLTFFFVFLFSPQHFIEVIEKGAKASWIFGVTGIILSLGFIISSFVEFIVIGFKLRGSYTNDEIAIGLLNTKFSKWYVNFKVNTHAQELASWIISDQIDKKNKGEVRNQINKRWHMAMANFNAVVGVSLAWTLIVIFWWCDYWSRPWSLLDIVISLIFIGIFLFNGIKTYKSVMEMDRILIRESFA